MGISEKYREACAAASESNIGLAITIIDELLLLQPDYPFLLVYRSVLSLIDPLCEEDRSLCFLQHANLVDPEDSETLEELMHHFQVNFVTGEESFDLSKNYANMLVGVLQPLVDRHEMLVSSSGDELPPLLTNEELMGEF